MKKLKGDSEAYRKNFVSNDDVDAFGAEDEDIIVNGIQADVVNKNCDLFPWDEINDEPMIDVEREIITTEFAKTDKFEDRYSDIIKAHGKIPKEK